MRFNRQEDSQTCCYILLQSFGLDEIRVIFYIIIISLETWENKSWKGYPWRRRKLCWASFLPCSRSGLIFQILCADLVWCHAVVQLEIAKFNCSLNDSLSRRAWPNNGLGKQTFSFYHSLSAFWQNNIFAVWKQANLIKVAKLYSHPRYFGKSLL